MYKQHKKYYVLIILLLVLCTSASLAQSVKRYEELPNFHQLSERLYRGGQPQSGGLSKLKELGIKTIINLRTSDDKARAEEIEAKTLGMRYFNIPLERLGAPSDAQIEQILSIINAQDNMPVFVHCHKGQDRTGMVIAIYRITHDRWTVDEALREAKKYGMKFWQLGMKDYIKDYAKRQDGIK